MMKRTIKFNKIMAVVLCLMMVMSTFTVVPLTASAVDAPAAADKWDGKTVTAWESMKGSGTEADPYLITSGADYKAMVANLNTWGADFSKLTYFKMTNDIDMQGNNPGGMSLMVKVQTGTDDEGNPTYVSQYPGIAISFDGNGHTIYNMTSLWGMFDCLGNGAIVKNFTLAGLNVTRAGNVAAIAMNVDGATIENVHIDDNSAIVNSAVREEGKAEEAGTHLAAGFVVRARSGALIIKDSTNAATVISAGGSAAGFVVTENTAGGTATALTLENCINKGDVTGNSYIGGMLAYAPSNTKMALTFTGCANYGKLTTTAPRGSQSSDSKGLGGMFGYIHSNQAPIVIENCYNYGDLVSESTYIGGMVGYIRTMVNPVTIRGCANYGDIYMSGKFSVGGMVGYLFYSAASSAGKVSVTLANNTNAGNVYFDSSVEGVYAGGIVGYLGEIYSTVVSFNNCVNTGDIVTSNNIATVGGIVGYYDKSSATFANCANDGDMKTGGNHGGGLIGLANAVGKDNAVAKTLSMTGCVNNGDVSAAHGAGGAIGSIENTSGTGWTISLNKMTNTGDVVCKQYAGGIVGKFQGAAAATPGTDANNKYFLKIQNSANVGDITGGDSYFAGGLVGFFNTLNVGTSGYWRILLENSYNYANVTALGGGFVGGLIGRQHMYSGTASNYPMVGTDIIGCVTAGHMSNTNQYAGGFFGDTPDDETINTITNSWTCVTFDAGKGRAWNAKINAKQASLGEGTTNSGAVANINAATADSTIAAMMEAINATIVGTDAPTAAISTASGNLSVRMKMTAPFGFLAITNVVNENGEAIDFHNGIYTLKFAFLTDTAAPASATALIHNANAVIKETSAYDTNGQKQYVEYDGLNAASMDSDIYFVCYLENARGQIVSVSEVRSINLYQMILDASDGFMYNSDSFAGLAIENLREVALYQRIVEYCDAYKAFN